MTPSSDEARRQLTEALVGTGEEDRDAFRTLYALTSAKLFGICLRICGDRHAAEDALHEVYLVIWRRAGAFDPGRGSAINWLAMTARSRAIDHCRAHGIRRTEPIEVALEIPDIAPIASDIIDARQASHTLHDCLDSLEVRQSATIRTAFFDGLTYAEIAQRDAVPLGTMKSWVRRGLALLKECLER